MIVYGHDGAHDAELSPSVSQTATPAPAWSLENLLLYSERGLLLDSPEGLDKTIHQKHSDYFLERAAWWNKVFKGPQQADTLIQADKEIEDVRAAWEWAARQMDQERLWRASEGLLMYFNLRYRFQEGEHACQVAIENLKKSPMREEWLNLEGWLLVWQALFFRTMGKVESAWQLLEASLNKLRRAESTGQDIRQGQALLWRENGNLAGSLPEQIDYHLLSASIYQDLCDPWWQALELAWAGELVNRLGDNLRSKKLLEKAVALSQEAGEPRRLAYCLSILAYYQLIYEKWEIGFELMKEAAYLSMSIGDMSSQATCELLLGVSLGWTGRKQEASDLLEIALAKLHQLGDRFNITYGTLGLGIIHLHSGKYEEAKLSLQECFRSARENGYRREEAHGLAEIGCLKLVQGPYEKALENIQQSVDSFRKMGFAGELSMALGGLTLAQHLLGNDQQAWSSLREALYIAADTHSRFTMFTLPVALLVLLVDAGRWEQAVEAYTAVMTDPIVATSVWFADMVGDRLEHAKDLLPEDSYLAAEERGREGDVFDVLARLLKEINSM
jgi:tetratricopeptide (TPR) repeat protein